MKNTDVKFYIDLLFSEREIYHATSGELVNRHSAIKVIEYRDMLVNHMRCNNKKEIKDGKEKSIN